jgi:hypothetical protein
MAKSEAISTVSVVVLPGRAIDGGYRLQQTTTRYIMQGGRSRSKFIFIVPAALSGGKIQNLGQLWREYFFMLTE